MENIIDAALTIGFSWWACLAVPYYFRSFCREHTGRLMLNHGVGRMASYIKVIAAALIVSAVMAISFGADSLSYWLPHPSWMSGMERRLGIFFAALIIFLPIGIGAASEAANEAELELRLREKRQRETKPMVS